MKVLLPWIILASVLNMFPTIEAASYLYLGNRMTHNEGKAVCRKFHLSLATVRSQQDMNDIKSTYSTVSGGTSAWLGIQYNGSKFLLPDKSIMVYENWNDVTDNEPDGLPSSSCVVVVRSHMMWHTRRCSQLNHVLCGPYDEPGVSPLHRVASHMQITLPEVFTGDSSKIPYRGVCSGILSTIHLYKGVIQDIRLTSFQIWRQDQSFLTRAISTHTGSSLRACAKACLVRGNCMFFSVEKTTCSTYINIDKLSTGNKKGSVIWKTSTLAID